MALRAGYYGIKKFIADKLNRMDPGDTFATDAEVAATAQQIYADMGVLGAKNLFDGFDSDSTLNHITFTVNSDKTVTVNNDGNAASANTFYEKNISLVFPFDVILSGCPSGGSDSSYRLDINGSIPEYGNGVVIPANTNITNIRIRIASGYKPDNLIFKPMISKASDTDPTYQPYAETNLQLTQNKTDISALGTQEGATASRLYHPGEHFYKDGQSCEVIGNADVAQGTTWTLNTNYKVKSVYDSLIKKGTFSGTTSVNGNMIVNGTTGKRILFAGVQNALYICLPYIRGYDNDIGLKILSPTAFEPVAETQISGVFYYIDE